MKTLITLIALMAIPAFGQDKAPVTPAAKAPAAKKKAVATKAATPTAKPLVIPKDATPNPDGTYSWADKAGKKWIFAKTPFGISRTEDMGVTGAFAALNTVPPGQYVKATEAGDKVRFERQSPFGTTKWEKSKADLTDEERAILASQATNTQSPSDKKPE